jgi:hypothetical protein
MAGEWIKINKSLPRDPRVVRISSALNADRLRTVGGLVSAWSLFDEQTGDGKLDAYTPELLDDLVGMPGLARAMEAVGWLEIGEGFLVVPRFEEHMSHSAKRRAQESARKQSARKADKCPQEKRTKSGLEKRRVDKRASLSKGSASEHVVEDDLPITKTTEGELRKLGEKVRSLRPQWQKMPLTHAEERLLFANMAALDALEEEDWNTLRQYLSARLEQGEGGWQPHSRAKFIETCPDVWARAEAWNFKQQKKPVRSAPVRRTEPREQTEEDKEAMADLLKAARSKNQPNPTP